MLPNELEGNLLCPACLKKPAGGQVRFAVRGGSMCSFHGGTRPAVLAPLSDDTIDRIARRMNKSLVELRRAELRALPWSTRAGVRLRAVWLAALGRFDMPPRMGRWQ